MKIFPVLLALGLLATAITLAEARLPDGRTVCRSAVTGEFVTQRYAKRHLKTTVCETR